MSPPFCYADGQERFWRAHFHDAIYLEITPLMLSPISSQMLPFGVSIHRQVIHAVTRLFAQHHQRHQMMPRVLFNQFFILLPSVLLISVSPAQPSTLHRPVLFLLSFPWFPCVCARPPPSRIFIPFVPPLHLTLVVGLPLAQPRTPSLLCDTFGFLSHVHVRPGFPSGNSGAVSRAVVRSVNVQSLQHGYMHRN